MAYDAATSTITDTTPEGRQSRTVLDVEGRPVLFETGGLTATELSYDVEGRIDGIARGARVTAMGYDTDGNLQSTTARAPSAQDSGFQIRGRKAGKRDGTWAIVSLHWVTTDSVSSVPPVPAAVGTCVAMNRHPWNVADNTEGIPPPPLASTVFVVEDDPAVRATLCELLDSVQLGAESYASAQEFLAAYDPARPGCLLLDVRMPGMSGLELQAELAARGIAIPIIMLTGYADVSMAVRALKAGAMDFIEKPVADQELLEKIQCALERDRQARSAEGELAEFASRVARLTPRECQVMDCLVKGMANKEIAAALDLSRKTVETHRANLMNKMRLGSLADLIRLRLLVSTVGRSRRG